VFLVVATELVKWKLRAIMADRQITNAELAHKVGLHVNTISKWKNVNEMPRISGSELDELCAALKCTVLDLLGEGKV
jgi:putative transcriptional regulator